MFMSCGRQNGCIFMSDVTCGILFVLMLGVDSRGMKVYKYFASCGYVFIYMLCPALRLVSDRTVDGTCVVNDFLVGEQITLVMGIPTHFWFGS